MFGGNFDPVHNGHLKIVEAVQQQIQPDRILLVPCGNPPHRDPPIANSAHRIKMLQLAVENIPGVEIDTREIDRDGASFSYLSLEELRQENPDALLLLAMGWDSLVNFTSWHRWQDILQIACLVVVGRDGDESDFSAELNRRIQHHSQAEPEIGKIIQLDFDETPVSSTRVRQLLQQGLPADSYLNPAVGLYLERHNIYRTKES